MGSTGVWRNSYDSIMALRDYGGGFIAGTYSSHTGSTGIYYVMGVLCPPAERDFASSLSLTIYWRSIEPGPGDPSWHWVSGLGGQLIEAGQARRLDLSHALISTATDLNGIPPGRYIDKLVFLPEPESSAPTADIGSVENFVSASKPLTLADPVWRCPGQGARLRVSAPDRKYGFVRGELTLDGKRWEALGFSDFTAGPEGLATESLALAAFSGEGGRGRTITLAGWRDIQKDELELSLLENRSTHPSLSYTQTTMGQMIFTR